MSGRRRALASPRGSALTNRMARRNCAYVLREERRRQAPRRVRCSATASHRRRYVNYSTITCGHAPVVLLGANGLVRWRTHEAARTLA